MWQEFFSYLGVFSLASFLFRYLYITVRSLFTVYCTRPLGINVKFNKLGQWAVVTGATDGIGKAYVEELAREGMDIVLVSRTHEKLQAVADNLAANFNVKTKTIAVDFTKGLEIYDKLRSELSGLDIGVLVNNVGMSYKFPQYYLQVEDGDEFTRDLINCNMLSCTMMCRIVMPQMVAKRKGAVINLSSLSCLSPFPFLSIYSASKAFVDYFTQGLQMEYRGSGVIIQSVVPAYVTTRMSKIKTTSFFVPSPKAFVVQQLSSVGFEDRTYGYVTHKIQAESHCFLISHCKPMFSYLAEQTMRTMQKIGQRKSSRLAVNGNGTTNGTTVISNGNGHAKGE